MAPGPPLPTPIYLQPGRINNCFYVLMTIFAQQFNICSPATRLATVTDDYAVLIIMWQLQVTKRLSPLAPTSVEQCHKLLLITWSSWIDVFS